MRFSLRRESQHLVRQALFLPEASDYIASSATESLSLAQPVSTSPFVLGLQSQARKARMAINVGIHEPAERGARLKNTLIWIDDQGNIAQKYSKLHLFDVDLKDGPRLKESESVEAGSFILPPFPTALGNVGLLICFDLRFPEASLSLRRQGASLITYPSAFTVPTGKAHWSPLLRSRAIETQTYVVAAAQVGQHNDKRVSYGHSMAISPWGEVLAELDGTWGGEPELAFFDFDASLVEKVRREVPLLRRTDVYPQV
ncbi:nitrilase-like protein [Trichodelitschia bisporula]|uniref:Nitrilase-like protein n=1 Tax=Trichodelitschia bisporula TaxID=703511 RepID=A0A6G1HZC8_9PEZI|nr:nitrilase-like protein [Trichodelitschia bisporula]